MNMKSFLKTWEGTQSENKWGRVFTAVLLGVIVALILMVYQKETVVTVQPWTLEEDAWVTKNNASQSYKEAWGLAFSILLGNVQPTTVGFIKDRLAPLLSPAIYQEVVDVLEVQAIDIKKDRVIMRFEPRAISYETKSNKVFVEGLSFIKGASSDRETSTRRTYEFEISINSYAPQLTNMNTYEGGARTVKELSKQKNNASRR